LLFQDFKSKVMKTKFKLLAVVIFTGAISVSNSISAQSDGCFSYLLGSPSRLEIQSTQPIIDFTQGSCGGSGANTLTGVGINLPSASRTPTSRTREVALRG
jgi:hypothetical protein